MNMGGVCGALDGTSWAGFLAFTPEVWAAKIEVYMVGKLQNLTPNV